jgi:hypothetical protein
MNVISHAGETVDQMYAAAAFVGGAYGRRLAAWSRPAAVRVLAVVAQRKGAMIGRKISGRRVLKYALL